MEREEDARGLLSGKPREKITTVAEMLRLINEAKKSKAAWENSDSIWFHIQILNDNH